MLHYRHGRPQRLPIPVEVTPEELERILAVAGEPDEKGYAAFELRLYDTSETSHECGCFDRETLEHIAAELRAGGSVEVFRSQWKGDFWTQKYGKDDSTWAPATAYYCAVEPIPDDEENCRLVLRAYMPLSDLRADMFLPSTWQAFQQYRLRRDVSWEVHCAAIDKLEQLQEEIRTKDHPLELIDTTVEHADALARRREPSLEDLYVARVVVAETSEGYGLHDLVVIANSIRDAQLRVQRKGSTKYFYMPVLATEFEEMEDGYRLVALLYHEGAAHSRVEIDDIELRKERERIDAERKTAEEHRKEHLLEDFRKGDVAPFVLAREKVKPSRSPRRALDEDERQQAIREKKMFRRKDRNYAPECEYVEATPELLEKLNATVKLETPLTADDVFVLRAVVGNTRNVSLVDSEHYARSRYNEGRPYVRKLDEVLRRRAEEYVAKKGITMTKHSYGSPYIRVPGNSRRLGAAKVFDAVYEPMPDYEGEYQLVAWFYVCREGVPHPDHPDKPTIHTVDIDECATLEAAYFAEKEAEVAERLGESNTEEVNQ